MPWTATQLARLRAVHTAALKTTCIHHRRTLTPTSAGGWTENWAVLGSLPCRLVPERDRRRLAMVGDRAGVISYYRLTLPYDADLRAEDEIQVNDHRYRVVALWEDHDQRTARRAVLVRVQ